MSDNEPMEAWLNEYNRKETRINNESNFRVYLAWTKKTPKQLIDEFDQVKTKSQILQFQNYLLNEYISPTTKQHDTVFTNYNQILRETVENSRKLYLEEMERLRKLHG